MKTIVLRSTNNQFRVELKVDLFETPDAGGSTRSEALTIMEISDEDALEVVAGMSLKELPNSVSGLAAFATSLNLLMDIVDIDPAIATENVVSSVTALSMTSTGAQAGGATGSAYHEQLIAAGGNGPLTFEVTSGALPSGLYLQSNGWISGTPDAVENPTFEVTVTDAFGGTDADATLSINIIAP